jgi:hypothetical protein
MAALNDWLRMDDLKRRDFNSKVWIPLYASWTQKEIGELGYSGYEKELFIAYSIIIPLSNKHLTSGLQWMDVNRIGYGTRPWFDSQNHYHEAEVFHEPELHAIYPVLEQCINVEQVSRFYVNQDLVIGLKLKEEKDKWVCPDEDYVDVIRLQKDENGKVLQIEIRAEFLKDYLCARESGLYLYTFNTRQRIQESFEELGWPKEPLDERNDTYHWEGTIQPVAKGGGFFGSMQFIHVARTDFDHDSDIPELGPPSDSNVATESWIVKNTKRPLYRAAGDLWKKHWVDPAAQSPKVREDSIKSKTFFPIDNQGTLMNADDLIESGRWLWFKPQIVREILKRQNGFLSWYTGDTGKLGTSNPYSVPFGVNIIGLINVYAEDIALLPEVDKKIWAAYAIPPDGQPSDELIQSQVQAYPADSIAVENIFLKTIQEMQELFLKKYNRPLFKEHFYEREILSNIHRFYSGDVAELALLAKQITKYVIERIDIDLLKLIRKESNDKLGSIKRLENILNEHGLDGRRIMTPLVGVYDLRKFDAHLPSSTTRESLLLIGINPERLDNNSAKYIIKAVSATLTEIVTSFLS